MYVPKLDPLFDALMLCDDDDESTMIMDLMDSFKNASPWPLKVHNSGLEHSGLNPVSFNALGEVCKDYYAHEGETSRRALRFPSPPRSPAPADAGPSRPVTRSCIKKEEVMVVSGGEGRGEGGPSGGGGRGRGGRGRGKEKATVQGKVRGSGRGRFKGLRRFDWSNPPQIVCALPSTHLHALVEAYQPQRNHQHTPLQRHSSFWAVFSLV